MSAFYHDTAIAKMAATMACDKLRGRLTHALVEYFDRYRVAHKFARESESYVIGHALHTMNVEALRECYKHSDQGKGLYPAEFKLGRAEPDAMSGHYYCDVRSYLYQCREGSIEESELFKAVEDYCNSRAGDIIRSQSETIEEMRKTIEALQTEKRALERATPKAPKRASRKAKAA